MTKNKQNILNSFIINELNNPITAQSITEALKNADSIEHIKYAIKNGTKILKGFTPQDYKEK